MATFEDPASRIEALLGQVEARLRNRFLTVVALTRSSRTLEDIASLLSAGRVDDAVLFTERAANALAAEWASAFILSGNATSDWLQQTLGTLVDFDQSNDAAVRVMRENRLRLIRNFTQDQRVVARRIIAQGIGAGTNPLEVARELRESIGLTPHQQRIIENYRRSLELGRSDALTRELRDRRSDSRVRSAVAGSRPLSRSEIDRLVSRYRQRWIAFRAQTIARTEGLRAVHTASRQAFLQAVEDGLIERGTLTQRWVTARDERVRGSHSFMNGQARRVDESFTSGDGNALSFPGDPAAPAADTINCRCVVATRFESSVGEGVPVPDSQRPAPGTGSQVALPRRSRAYREAYDRWAAGLIPSQRRAFASWQGQDGHRPIRAIETGNPELLSQFINLADARLLRDDIYAALASAPRAANTVLYRGLNLSPEQLARLGPGSVFENDALSSWSSQRRQAARFTGLAGGPRTIFRVRTSSGFELRRLDPDSPFARESEFLIERGKRFRVTGISIEGRNIIYDLEDF